MRSVLLSEEEEEEEVKVQRLEAVYLRLRGYQIAETEFRVQS